MNDRPRRRLTLDLSAHADTIPDMLAVLDELRQCVADGQIGLMTTGGCGSGWFANLQDNPARTPELYESELTAWLNQRTLESQSA